MERYYEIITPPHAGRAIVIQQFQDEIGVGYLHFGEDHEQEIKELGGRSEPAHYGPDEIHDQFCSREQGSHLFPIAHKEAVIALTHKVVDEIEQRYAMME